MLKNEKENSYNINKILMLKIISWNCNGALRQKFQSIDKLKADIYIIQECENPCESKHDEFKKWASNHLWTGSNKNKGIGIFASSSIKIKRLDWSNIYLDHEVKHFLPCRINDEFNLVGVWTHKNNSPNFPYIGQFWKYLQVNKDKLGNAIIGGDFNSNVIWDEWDRWWNHSDVIKELESLNIHSVYHHYFNEEQGKEEKPTLFFRKNKLKTYHIDYFFAHKYFIDKLQLVEVGKHEEWIGLSDHMPIVSSFITNEKIINNR